MDNYNNAPHSDQKSGSFRSFARNGSRRKGNATPVGNESDTVAAKSSSPEKENAENPFLDPDFSQSQVAEEVDRFLETLSATGGDKSSPPEVPNSIELLLKVVQSMIDAKYESQSKFGQNQEEDSCFLESVNRISRLMEMLGEFSSNSTAISSCFNRASSVLHRAMSLLDDELRVLLEDSMSSNNSDPKSLKTKQSSFNSLHDSDRCALPETESAAEDEFPAFSPEIVSFMNKIATAMISASYETECCLVYSILRRNAFKTELNKLGFDTISIDDVQRTQWEALEREIATWISVVKHCSAVLFPGERRLCESVFFNFPKISQKLFTDLAKSVAMKIFNFAESVVLTRRSAEKLFKFLDMYETLRDFILAMDWSFFENSTNEMISEASALKSRVGEAVVSIFSDLENSIKNDNGRTPVPGGAVHPLTRYSMNYLKYACEYKDTLEQVFQQRLKIEAAGDHSAVPETPKTEKSGQNNDRTPKLSPFAVQLSTIMDLLDANLDMKSKLYKDPSLRYIFLMNNGRYIFQKIKGSVEIHQLMGDNWCRKRSSDLRQYHKNYQRETWGRLLQCLNHEELQVNGKISKPVLKERFKSFNGMFDEIHKTQSSWVVSDEQLQSELRVSISAVVIPAYRSFLGRFKQYFDSSRKIEKYVKYQGEDIETLIEELFAGNPAAMTRRKHN